MIYYIREIKGTAGNLLALLLLFFLVLIALEVSVSYSMLLTNLMYILSSHRVSMSFILQGVVSGLASCNAMYSPSFIMVGCVMNEAGVTGEIFELADCPVDHIKGELGHVNVVASLISVDISGSVNADTTSLGNVEIKAVTEEGFDRGFIVDITTASSMIGPIFPPFNPVVYVGVMAGVSIGALSLDGTMVGVLIILFMCITIYTVARRCNYPVRKRTMTGEIRHAFRRGSWVLMTPVILTSCIQNGNATPTEAEVVALVYMLFISIFIYKTIKFRDLYGIMAQAINNIGLVLMLISSGKVFAWALGGRQVAEIVSKGLLSLTTNPWLILLLISLFLLSPGTFTESIATITIAAPILFPITLSIGFNPVRSGVIFVLGLMIGILTPSMAVVLLIVSKIGEISFERAFKAMLPYYVTLLLAPVLVNLSPILTPGLSDLMLGGYE